MRLLLDECVPQRLSRQLQEFEVSHVASEGWAGRRNGDLLRAMRIAGFDVLVTVDRNLV
jgi:predicted nuclease of predicted toxin-antitoxin system